MGTNYYYIKDPCEHCGRGDERLHIGKSSYGWEFTFCGHKEEGIESLEDWKGVLMKAPGIIKDEYGRQVTLTDLLKLIESKRGGVNHARLATQTRLRDQERDCMDEHPTDFGGYTYQDWWLDKDDNGFSSLEFS